MKTAIVIEKGLSRTKFGAPRFTAKVNGEYICDPCGVMIIQYDSYEAAQAAAENMLKKLSIKEKN